MANGDFILTLAFFNSIYILEMRMTYKAFKKHIKVTQNLTIALEILNIMTTASIYHLLLYLTYLAGELVLSSALSKAHFSISDMAMFTIPHGTASINPGVLIVTYAPTQLKSLSIWFVLAVKSLLSYFLSPFHECQDLWSYSSQPVKRWKD